MAGGLTSDQVAAEIVRVQNKADKVAERFTEAEDKAGQLATQVAAAQTEIDQTSAQLSKLQSDLTQVALDQFMSGSSSAITSPANAAKRWWRQSPVAP